MASVKDVGGLFPITRTGNQDNERIQINNLFSAVIDLIPDSNESAGGNTTPPAPAFVSWGDIQGDIVNQSDLIAYLQNNVTGETNLSVVRNATTVTVESSTGDNAVIPAADATSAGVMTEAQFDQLQGIPSGGTTGQVLTKSSGTDYDTEWAAASGGGGGSIVNVSGAGNYTVTDSNDGDVIVCDTPTRGVRFVDCDSAVSVNTRIRIVREGEGRVQFRGTGGDVVRSPSGVDPLISEQYGFGYAVKIASGQWRAEGQGLAEGSSYLDLQPYSSDNMNLTL